MHRSAENPPPSQASQDQTNLVTRPPLDVSDPAAADPSAACFPASPHAGGGEMEVQLAEAAVMT